MSEKASLFSLLERYFPNFFPQDWKITPLVGLSGGTYLLQAQCSNQSINVIARADGKTQSSLYVDRDKEARVLKQLEQFSHAPKLLGRNSHWLLLTWCEGHNPDYITFVSPEFQVKLANIITQLHSYPLFNYRLQLRNEIAHYGVLIDKKRLSPKWKKIHQQFLTMKMPKILKLAPAHMDIHCGNVVSQHDGKIMLLDWEYAANTDIAFSLETYFQFNGLTKSQQDFFLDQYCGTVGAYRDKIQLVKHCSLWSPWVKYMMLMWYEVRWNESQQPQFLLQSQALRQYFNLLG